MEPCKKDVFPNEFMALEFAKVMKKKHGSILDAYKCPDCHNWHLTSQKSKIAKINKLTYENAQLKEEIERLKLKIKHLNENMEAFVNAKRNKKYVKSVNKILEEISKCHD